MKHAAALTVLLAAAPVQGLELSLADDRADRGSVGFIDMQRVFADSPDAARAKESFSTLVRQAEERLNLKKAELMKLRQELSTDKALRDNLAKSSPTASSVDAAASTAPIVALPAISTAAVSTSTSAAAQSGNAPSQALELDAKIAALQTEISRQEAALAREREEVDKGLIDIEGRKTDQVLARLYRVISDVARREGLSIVVDKSAILYGHQGVDLTDKVLKALRNPQP